MKLPCKDCITLAICKSIQASKHKRTFINMTIYYRCSLLKEFVKSGNIGSKLEEAGEFLDKKSGESKTMETKKSDGCTGCNWEWDSKYCPHKYLYDYCPCMECLVKVTCKYKIGCPQIKDSVNENPM